MARPKWEGMMGIAQKVSRDFSDAVRSRGQSYFAKGRVAITAATAGEVVARVRGTAKYRVRLRLRGAKLPRLVLLPVLQPDGEPCKHLWATILMADARGLLQAAPVAPAEAGQRPAAPRRRPTPAGGPDRSAAAGAGRRLARAPARPAPPAPGPRPQGPPDRGPGPGRPGAGPGTGRPGPGPAAPCGAKPVNRNAKRLLVYVLDVPATLSQNQVVIDLARRQRRPSGDWGPLKPWWHAPGVAAREVRPRGPRAAGAAGRGARPLARPAARHHGGGTAHGPAEPTIDGDPPVRPPPATRRRWSSGSPGRGRLRLRRTDGEDDPPTMRWDDGPPWRFSPRHPPRAGRQALVAGAARSAGATRPTAWTWPSRWCSCPAC